MKLTTKFIFLLIVFSLPMTTLAHSGGTDKMAATMKKAQVRDIVINRLVYD